MFRYRAGIETIKHRARRRYCMAMLAGGLLGSAYAATSLPLERPVRAPSPKSAMAQLSHAAKIPHDRNACGLKPGGVVVVLPIFIVGGDADGQAVFYLGHIDDPVCTLAI